MDYANLFMQQNPTPFTNAAINAPTPWYQNQDLMTLIAGAMGKLGASMSGPGTPGEALGNIAAGMANARMVNKGNVATAGITPGQTAPAKNPTNVASGLKAHGKFLEDAFKLDPTLAPEGFMSNVSTAFQTDPSQYINGANSNPTQPVSDNVGEAFAPPVQADISPIGAPVNTTQPIPDMVALGMTPEQIRGAYDFSLASQKQANDNLLKPTEAALNMAQVHDINFKLSPSGQAFALKVAGESARVQTEGIRNLEADKRAELEKQMSYLQTVPMTGEFRRILGAKNWADAVKIYGGDVGNVISAARSAQAALEAAMISASAQGRADEFAKTMKLFQDSSDTALKYESLPTYAEWSKMTDIEKMLQPKYKTPATDEALRVNREMRDRLGLRLYGPEYQKILNLKKIAEDPNKGVITVTPEMRKESDKRHMNDKKYMLDFSNFFNPHKNKYQPIINVR